MRVTDVLLGLGRHEGTRVFDGMYAIRGTIPPRPACGERIEVRGRAQSETRGLTHALFLTSAYGIGNYTLRSPALSAPKAFGVVPGSAPHARESGSCGGLALNCAPLALSTYKRPSADLSPTRMLTFPARA